MMLHIPAVLTKPQVQEIRQRLAQADWIDGRATAGEQSAQVKRNRQLPDMSPLARELGGFITQALAQHPLFFAAVLPLRILPPYFNSYAGGGHYGMHVDGAVRTRPGTANAMRADVSSTLFLSEPEEYDGGELVVMDAYGTHEVKLAAGDLIVYPASSVHRVEPVTRASASARSCGRRAWCARTPSAACCSSWTRTSRSCAPGTATRISPWN